MELFTNVKNLIILVTSCFVVIGNLTAKVNGDRSIQQEVDQLFRKSQNSQIFYQMNWFMLANELIQHSRNTSIATAVNRKSTTTSLNLYLITLTVTGNEAQQTGTAETDE